MEIRYVDRALANNFGDYIEINENLKLYPELHDALLGHELAHSSSQGFTKKDFLLDISSTNVSYWKLFKFMVKYPKSFLQFAPVYKQGKTLFYDINMCIVWGILFVTVGLSVFFSLR
jgi:hypothetical protein